MKRSLVSLAIAFLFLFAFSSCAHLQVSPAQQQLEARKTFNNLVENYLIKFRAADSKTQQEWREKVDPILEKAETALDAWRLALIALDPDKAVTEEKLFLELKGKLLDLLIGHFVEE